MSEQKLKNKAVKGVVWSATDNVLKYVVNFIITIILARLLSPEDYGLIGLISIFSAICTALIEGGFSSALIRKKDATEDDFNTVFLVNLLMSVLLYGVLFLCAPLIANFFNRQELVALTRVSTLSLIIGALAMTQYVRLTKRLDFKSQTKITFLASICGGVIGIIMAYAGFGVWAIVGQYLGLHIVKTIALWFVNKWIPKFKFSVTSFKELFGFGWKLMVSTLIDTGWKEIYQVVIGKCYTPATLGYFTRAKSFGELFSTNLTGVVSRVSYPTLSQIQDDKVRLKSAYKQVIKTTMFVTFILMLGLAAIAKPLILVLIGEKWLPSVPMLQIICFQMMLYPLNAINLNMLQVQGRSDLFLKLEIIKKIILIGPILLGIFVGIYWMLIGSVITGFISYFLNSYYSGTFLCYSVKEQVIDILPSFCLAMTVSVVVFLLSMISLPNIVLLLIQIVLGMLIVISFCEFIKFKEYILIKNICLSHFPIQKK